MNFGLDFGTTNSAICLIKDGDPIPLTLGDIQGATPYIPSALARKETTKNKFSIGYDAIYQMRSAHAHVFTNFKMLLHEENPKILEKWGYNQDITPEKATEIYLRLLFSKVKEEHQIAVSKVVVTVPEIWIRQNLHAKRDFLIRCFNSLGIDQIRVESEPLAAASYFLSCYKKEKKDLFTGHLLVCDCGGGTMDFCLTTISYQGGVPNIEILERAGNGQVSNSLGSAGVAFDEAVIDALFPDLRIVDQSQFFELVHEFEMQKIQQSNNIDYYLEIYTNSPDSVSDEKIITLRSSLGEGIVTPVLLNSVFDDLISKNIVDALNNIFANMADNDFIYHPEHFRVVMVGGFSRFFLVRQTIREYFKSQTASDTRFEKVFHLRDTVLAIAKGAALISNEMARIIQTCPLNVGIVLDTHPSPTYEIILKQSEKISAYQSPQFYKKNIGIKISSHRNILDRGLLNCSLKIFLHAPTEPRKLMSISGALPDSFQSYDYRKEMLRIGFSIDENMIFSIHIRHYMSGSKRLISEKITKIGDLQINAEGKYNG